MGDDTLTPAEVVGLARRPGATLVLDGAAEARMRRSVAARDILVASGEPVYGVTTGFGASVVHQVSAAKAAELQAALIRYHLVGSGPTAPDEVVRASIVIRANCLARGCSGVRPEVVRVLLELLAHDLLPVVPERGSVGASGDLVPLCYVADVVTGGGQVWQDGELRPTAEALADAGIRPVTLQPKEALALINGTSFMSGFAVLAAADSVELAVVAEACTALAVEVLRGNRGAFAPFVHAQKPHPGQLVSAAAVFRLLEGSGHCHDPASIRSTNPDIGEADYQRLAQPIQDRYSLRCAPHVVGVLRDTTEWVDRWLGVEICSTNDNPLFDPESATVHNGGNFYGGHVALAMDSLKVAVASVGDLLDRQLALVVDDKFNNGLTPNLIRPPANAAEAGLDHGFKGVQIAASALAAEALKLGMPATAFSRSTEAHNQDKVSMGTIAARDARAVLDIVFDLAALHLAALAQAADLRGADGLGDGSRRAYEVVRRHVRFSDRDRRLDIEIGALAAALRGGAMSAALTPLTAGTVDGRPQPAAGEFVHV